MKTKKENQPSKEKHEFWIMAERKVGSYPKHTKRVGKWLIFVPRDAVDEVWHKIKLAIEEGKLGRMTKVSTAKPNPNSTDPSKHVLCVYTYDADDKDDAFRVRASLKELGFIGKLSYKTDDATFQGKYRKAGDKRISLYYE
jgi:Domain of unknown function (DUF1917)